MENNKTITSLVETAFKQLEDEFKLTEGTLKGYKYSSFRPIEEFFRSHGVYQYDRKLIDELHSFYITQFEEGIIPKQTFALRLRGIEVITEIQEKGCFEWKVFRQTKKELLNDYFEKILNDFLETLTCGAKRSKYYESIIRKFFSFLLQKGYADFTKFNPQTVSDFLTEISIEKPKSMDDVIYGMRKLFLHLNENGKQVDFNILLLASPKHYRRKIYPCMKTDELSELLNHIDQSTPKGKRDYAILILAATAALRAGDLVTLKLKDVDWQRCEISLVQGKTKEPLVLPLNPISKNALADYILNGRPTSSSPNIFLRSVAPHIELASGVSVACILRGYIKSMGIERKLDDGKTLQGIRRMLASNMTISKVPITTISQVLGHKNMDIAKVYISLDMEELKCCTLDFNSLKRGEVK